MGHHSSQHNAAKHRVKIKLIPFVRPVLCPWLIKHRVLLVYHFSEFFLILPVSVSVLSFFSTVHICYYRRLIFAISFLACSLSFSRLCFVHSRPDELFIMLTTIGCLVEWVRAAYVKQ